MISRGENPVVKAGEASRRAKRMAKTRSWDEILKPRQEIGGDVERFLRRARYR